MENWQNDCFTGQRWEKDVSLKIGQMFDEPILEFGCC